MSLLSPWMLSFLVVLPLILIFYLLKRTYQDVTVPSLLLWQQLLRDMEANRSWQKLKRNLLLLLQLLVALLLAVALARPMMPSATPVADHTIVVLDVSASMAAQTGEMTRLEQNKADLRELISQMGPQQEITLISMGQEPRVLATGSDRMKIEQALAKAEQEYGKVDYEGSLSLAAALSSKDAGSDVRIYSDGNWGIDPAMFPTFGNSPTLILSAGTVANLAVRHAAAVSQGGQTALVATVEHVDATSQDVELEVYDAAGKLLETTQLQVNSQGKASHSWTGLPKSPFYQVKVKSDDPLLLDNERIVLPEQSMKAKAWIASEGNLFLEKALGLGGGLTLERGTDPDAPPTDANLYVYDGVLPTEWPNGSVLLVNPPQGRGIVNITGTVEAGNMQVVTPESPILSHVDLSGLHLKEVQAVESNAWLQPLVKSGDTPILSIGEQKGHRLAVVAFDLHQSDLPLLPAFPLLIKHLNEYLMPVTGQTLGTLEAGMRMPLVPPIRETGWQYLDPTGEKHPIDGTLIEQGFEPAMPGLYRFQGEQGEELLLSVTLPAEESRLSATPVELPTTGNGEEGAAGVPVVEAGQTEIWRYFALLILLLVFVEWGVYKRGI